MLDRNRVIIQRRCKDEDVEYVCFLGELAGLYACRFLGLCRSVHSLKMASHGAPPPRQKAWASYENADWSGAAMGPM